jgi:hypothetical protein
MKTPCIKLTRYPYEEPYHLNLHIEAANERVNGNLEYYCNAKDLTRFGKQLADFTGTPEQEVIYELGSEDPRVRFAFFLSLRVIPLDSLGHCAILIRLNNNREPAERQVTEFSIPAEVADINRLGDLLITFGRLEHRVLEWRVHEGSLIKGHEDASNFTDTLEIPELIEIPDPAPCDENPVATADFLITALIRKHSAMLHAEFHRGDGHWFLRDAQGHDDLIARSKTIGEFRAVLVRFGHHHMNGQLYGGHARRTVAQHGRKFACEIFMSNQGWTGYWIRLYAMAI